MRVLLVGATGTIGSEVARELAKLHEVVAASRSSDVAVDISDENSIKAMYETLGAVDAVVCCAGDAAFAPLDKLTGGDIDMSLRSKLLGQVNLVRHGVAHVRDGGSFTLTAGIFSQKPMPGVPAVAMVNGAVESFARGAALDMPRGIRVNAVSPPFIKETAEKMGMEGQISAAENAATYANLVNGTDNGAVVYPG